MSDGGSDAANSQRDASSDQDDSGSTPDTGSTEDARPDQDTRMHPADASADVNASDAHVVAPLYHRPDDSQCLATRPEGSCALAGSVAGTKACFSDSDCTGGTNGRCLVNSGGPAGCSCSYDDCQSDSDCAANQACVCHGSAYTTGGNVCIPVSCRVDSDCGVNGFCSPSAGPCVDVDSYYCHTPSDTCINDSDCISSEMCRWSSSDAHWECMEMDVTTCPI